MWMKISLACAIDLQFIGNTQKNKVCFGNISDRMYDSQEGHRNKSGFIKINWLEGTGFF